MAQDGKYSNRQVAELLRSVSAALAIKKGSIFQVRAYETAADGIEHSTSEIKDLWEEGKLDQIPGVGTNLTQHLEEYFKTGSVKHFDKLKQGIKDVVFELLNIPGVGPKTAQELAGLGINDLEQLENQIKSGELVKKGFSGKIAEKIALGLLEVKNKGNRMLLPYASAQANKILEYLKKGPGVTSADPLGSLRRRVATIGDLDFAAASTKPEELIEYFTKVPGVSRILDKGENKTNLIMHSGVQVDLLVGEPKNYGALLQHFTGSKHHNIKLRTYALEKGYSLSEYGVKNVKSERIIPIKDEHELYKILGMDTPDPEIREDNGEIEAAIKHELPKLVKVGDIQGDLHLHSNFPMVHPSHGPGVNSIQDIIENAISLGYDYVGISDHPPGFNISSEKEMVTILDKRTRLIEQLKSSYKKKIRVLNGLEIDILPNGTLSVPNQILETLDYCIAGVHSSHRMEKEKMTKRLLTALESPHVDIISHPTNRLLNERDSSEADWEVIFEYCGKNNKTLEINSFPNRLDLRDDLVKLALTFGVKFVIDTDAHEVSQMNNMEFGISVARRGWVSKKEVVNAWDWKKFSEWFKIKT